MQSCATKAGSSRFASLTIGMLLACTASFAAAQGSGLSLDDQARFGPRLQARVGINTGSSLDGWGTSWQQQAGVVLGDYYFSRARLGSSDVSGGFRATSGLLLGQRSLALGTPALTTGQGFTLTMLRQARWATAVGESVSEPWAAVPYLGIGWSGMSPRGGWGLSADLGFAARAATGGLRVGNAMALDDLLREWRLTPMLHVGVSYAF